MRTLTLIFICLQAFSSSAAKLEYLGSTSIAHKLKFQKTKIGGLSGLVYSADEKKIWAVSDDRGQFNEPRIYEFSVEWKGAKLNIEPTGVLFLQNKNQNLKIFDLEGIALLPWGNFLLSSEGDNNHRPRIRPQVLDVKKNGTIIREYALPEHFLPELSGKQKNGIQNNKGFEGLTTSADGQSWYLAAQAPLLQDMETNLIRILRYRMPEAWIIKADQEFAYPLDKAEKNGEKLSKKLEINPGISEILGLESDKLLVMERSVVFGGSLGLQFAIKLYLADLTGAQDTLKLNTLNGRKIIEAKKQLLFDFEKLRSQGDGMPGLSMVQNFEGMCWGPLLPDGRKTILFVSDDNFKSELSTDFVLMAFTP